MEFLERLRKKPRETKNRYALLIALILTGVIASLWIFSVPARFEKIAESGTEAAAPSMFEKMLDSAGGQLGSIMESFTEEAPDEAPQDTESKPTFKALESLSGEQSVDMLESGTSTKEMNEPAVEDTSSTTPQTTSDTSEQTAEETKNSTTKKEPKTVLIGTTTRQQ